MTIQLRVPPLRPSMVFTDKNGNLTKDGYDFLFAIFTRVGGSLSNLDAASLLGSNWANPPPIGNEQPATGKFTMFGCNGKLPQPGFVVGNAVTSTAATSTSPFGFATAAQANDIVAKLNAVIVALKNNGILI